MAERYTRRDFFRIAAGAGASFIVNSQVSSENVEAFLPSGPTMLLDFAPQHYSAEANIYTKPMYADNEYIMLPFFYENIEKIYQFISHINNSYVFPNFDNSKKVYYTNKKYMGEKRNVLLFLSFIFAGLIPGAFSSFGKYYYYHLAGREQCNTGIAPCFTGFFEMIFVTITGWIISLLCIYFIMGYSNIPPIRKLSILIFGSLTIFIWKYIFLIHSNPFKSFGDNAENALLFFLIFTFYTFLFHKGISPKK